MMIAHSDSEKALDDLMAAVHLRDLLSEMIITQVVFVSTKGRVEVIPPSLLPALLNGIRAHLDVIHDTLSTVGDETDGH